jgi:hypothetical protein
MNCFALSWGSFHGRLRLGHGHASTMERNNTRSKTQIDFLKLDTVTIAAKRALKSPAVVCSSLGSKGDPRVKVADVDTNRALSMREYEDLKALLLRRTWRFGTLFSLYLLLSVSAKAAIAELLGVGGSYAYLLWLMHDIDAYGPDSKVGMQRANAVEPALARFIARLVAAYVQALSPRLLIPASLVGIIWIWDTSLPEFQLNLAEQGCMIGGFLSYKVALVLKVYDDLKPRPLTEEEMLQLSRPQLVDIEDVPLYIPKGPSSEPNDEKRSFNDE